MNKTLKYFLLSGAVVLFLLGAYLGRNLYLKGPAADDFLTLEIETEAWFEAFTEIEREWTLAPSANLVRESEATCQQYVGNLSEVDLSHLRCHPGHLACLGALKKTFGPRELTLSKDYEIKRASSGELHYQFELRDEKRNQQQTILLSPSCRALYLPERLYALGAAPRSDESELLLWDNVGRRVFIDRSKVTYHDISDFLKILTFKEYEKLVSAKEREFLQGLIKSENLAAPAIELNFSLQQKYCAVWGKQVLSAEVFDAATFLPFSNEEKFPLQISRSPYPWSKRRAGVFLFEKVTEPTSEDCRRAFVSECSGRHPNILHDPLSNSWIGLKSILGGEIESMRNPIRPRQNVLFSSRHFSSSSPWHQLGVRGYWDGEGFDYRNFNFGLADPVKGATDGALGVSFRCMKEVGGDL